MVSCLHSVAEHTIIKKQSEDLGLLQKFLMPFISTDGGGVKSTCLSLLCIPACSRHAVDLPHQSRELIFFLS